MLSPRIELILVSRQVSYWNRCLNKTVKRINYKGALKGWDQKAKESVEVDVCNR